MKSSAGDEVVVARFHALLRERTGVLDRLLADAPEARVVGRIILVAGLALQHAARPELLPEVRKILLRWIVVHLRLLFRVEVIEVAVELVEPVDRRQELVAIAEMVLAELSRHVSERLQEFGDRGILGAHALRSGRDAHFRQTRAIAGLPGDERRPPGGTGLLAVRIGEHHPFRGEPVDVWCLIAHQPAAVATQIRNTDVISPDDQNVRFLLVRHDHLLGSSRIDASVGVYF